MKNRINSLLQAAVALSVSTAPVQAGILYWDGSDSTVSADGGNGTWDTVLSNWDSLAISGANTTWPGTGTDNDSVFGGSAGTVTVDAGGVTANDLTFNTANYLIQGGKITLNGTTPTISNAAAATINSEIAGTAGLTKTGAGTLTLGAANTYTGTTTLNAGTLLLSGGNNRLATTETLSFSGSSTLDLGGNGQTLGNLSVTSGGTVNNVITNGSLTLSGASNLVIAPPASPTTAAAYSLDASGLSSLVVSKSANTLTVGGNGAATVAQTSTFKLSATSNTITVAALNVGANGGTGTIVNSGTLALGTTNAINATNITVGSTRSNANLSFQTGLTGPAATFRGVNGGTERITKFTVGINGAGGTAGNTQIADFSLGSIDARITDLIVSQGQSAATTGTPPSVNGTFTMGLGTLDATRIILSDNTSGGANSTNTGIFNQNAGTVTAGTLTLGQRTGSTLTPILSASYNLGTSTTTGILKVATVQAGAGTVSTSTVRRINFNNGTLQNYDSSTDLSINGSATAAESRINIILASTGTHAFLADPGRTITVGANTNVSGTGGTLTKTGAGTLILAGTNSYTGVTDVQNGTLQLTSALGGSSALNLGNGGNSGKVVLGNGTASNQTVAGLTTTGSGNSNAIVGSATAVSALTVNLASGSNTFGGSLGGSGTNENSLSLTKLGAGALTLSAANTFSGGTSVGSGSGTAGGILAATHAQALGSGGIAINGSNNIVSTLQLSNDISITGAGAITLSFSRNTIAAGGAAHIQNLSGNNSLSSNITLATAATGGTGANILSTSGTLTLTGNLTNSNSSSRAFVFSGAGNTAVSGNILTGGGGVFVQKDGDGTLTLSGTGSTFAGGTTVSAGTLLASNASGSATGTGAVTVNGGTLGGTGSISGAVTINTTATLSPGASIESLATGALTLNTGSSFVYELNTTGLGTADLVDVNGNLDLNGTVTLSLTDLGTNSLLALGTKFTMISYFGSWTTGDIFDGYADDATFTLLGNDWRINYDDVSAGSVNGGAFTNAVTLTVIPEPTAPMLAGGLGLLALLRRRRR